MNPVMCPVVSSA